MSKGITKERINRLEEALEDLVLRLGYRIAKVETKTGIKDAPFYESYRVLPK